MPERYIILSDLHFGRAGPEFTPVSLRGLWRAGDHLIINGDCAELHDPRYWDVARRQVLELEDLCEADGVTLTLLAGNHDPSISPLRHLFLAGGEVLVTHGDVIHPAIAPWCHTAPLIRSAFREAMSTLPVESHATLQSRLWASQHAATVKWERVRDQIGWISPSRLLLRPWAFVQILIYWATFPREVRKFVADYAPESKIVVLGHTHRQGVWIKNGVTVINTGAYGFPAKPRAVLIEGREMSVLPLRRSSAGYVFGKPIARFPLHADSPHPAPPALA